MQLGAPPPDGGRPRPLQCGAAVVVLFLFSAVLIGYFLALSVTLQIGIGHGPLVAGLAQPSTRGTPGPRRAPCRPRDRVGSATGAALLGVA